MNFWKKSLFPFPKIMRPICVSHSRELLVDHMSEVCNYASINNKGCINSCSLYVNFFTRLMKYFKYIKQNKFRPSMLKQK